MNRVVLLSLLLPATLAAQLPVAESLKPANATLTAGFKNVSSMQELHDGRVVLSDLTAGLFGVGNFTTGKFEPTASINPGPIARLGGDTSLMYRIRPEWIFLVAGKPIGMLPADNPVVAAAGNGYLYGADLAGHVLFHGKRARNDSFAVIRLDRSTAEQDTVTWFSEPPLGATRPVFQVYERATMAQDGWIAVLRMAPYRVDWRSPDGHWTLGAPVPFPVVKMDAREKELVMARRAMGDKPESTGTIANWPDAVPPFTTVAPITSPDGKLLVHRMPSADFPNVRYDVINHRGDLERQITMPANEHIVGFGAKSVYVAVDGKGGEQAIQRHPWP